MSLYDSLKCWKIVMVFIKRGYLKSCSSPNEVKINIDLPNLFNFILCLSPSNDHINNLKDYGDFAEENKQYYSYEIKW